MDPFADMNLLCKDCNTTFEFCADEQRYFAKHGFLPPTRCDACRVARMHAKKEKKKSGKQRVEAESLPASAAAAPMQEAAEPQSPAPARAAPAAKPADASEPAQPGHAPPSPSVSSTAKASKVAGLGVAKYSSAERFRTPALKRGALKEALALFHEAAALFGDLNAESNAAHRADGVGVLRNIGAICFSSLGACDAVVNQS